LNLTILTRSPNPDTRVLDVEGEIDVYTSTQLKEAIVSTISEGVTHVVMNLSKVEYLDSTGLGVLIGALKRLREKQGNLIIVSPSMRIMRIFEITGLYKIFTIYQTEDEAASKEGITL
jgi:anti-sigma B factor antagonist